VAKPGRSVAERREAAAERRARRSEITDQAVVMEAAATFLSVRSRSVEETRRRLRHLGYPPALCDEVVERLTQLEYLDDEAFATAWVESRDRAKPRGEVALRRELQLKGVPEDVIRGVIETRSAASHAAQESDDHSGAAVSADRRAAERLLERRSSSLRRETDPRKRRQRAYALLARSGFTPDICHEVASTVDADAIADESV
jgi:regulatory protein